MLYIFLCIFQDGDHIVIHPNAELVGSMVPTSKSYASVSQHIEHDARAKRTTNCMCEYKYLGNGSLPCISQMRGQTLANYQRTPLL